MEEELTYQHNSVKVPKRNKYLHIFFSRNNWFFFSSQYLNKSFNLTFFQVYRVIRFCNFIVFWNRLNCEILRRICQIVVNSASLPQQSLFLILHWPSFFWLISNSCRLAQRIYDPLLDPGLKRIQVVFDKFWRRKQNSNSK